MKFDKKKIVAEYIKYEKKVVKDKPLRVSDVIAFIVDLLNQK